MLTTKWVSQTIFATLWYYFFTLILFLDYLNKNVMSVLKLELSTVIHCVKFMGERKIL